MRNRAFVIALFGAAVCLAAQAQPTFEAATIKPSTPGRRGSGMNLQAARVRFISSTLKFCIQMAWDVHDFQVVGGPGWTDTDIYDIEAVAAAPFKGDEYRTMIQALLADRFGLVVRHGTQEKPGYGAGGGEKRAEAAAADRGSQLPVQPNAFRRHHLAGHQRDSGTVSRGAIVPAARHYCRQNGH